MRFKKIIRLFKDGNVCVTGLRGTGKDMLMANVVARRHEPYVSNLDYNCKNSEYLEFNHNYIDCGKNTYRNFVEDDLKYYEYPYPLGSDIYLSDVGVYYPAQYCNELNKNYPFIPVFSALSRQVAHCNFHFNVQNLNRAWDKLREQADQYIRCRRCIVLFGKIVLQWVTIYDQYDSCVQRLRPFTVAPRLMDKNVSKAMLRLEKQKYECQHGLIKSGFLLYINRSDYDTYYFQNKLKEGRRDEK